MTARRCPHRIIRTTRIGVPDTGRTMAIGHDGANALVERLRKAGLIIVRKGKLPREIRDDVHEI